MAIAISNVTRSRNGHVLLYLRSSLHNPMQLPLSRHRGDNAIAAEKAQPPLLGERVLATLLCCDQKTIISTFGSSRADKMVWVVAY